MTLRKNGTAKLTSNQPDNFKKASHHIGAVSDEKRRDKILGQADNPKFTSEKLI
jgi:hypothetical protein